MTKPLKSTGKLVKAAAASLLLLGLAACATPFKADVSRFQSQLPAPDGQSFAVVAEDPKLAGGLEFALYADLVEAEMARLGYAQVEPENATLLVRFDYGVDNGRERIRTTGGGFGRVGYYDPFFGPWRRSAFSFRRGYAFGFYDPFLDEPDVRSYTVYTSGIDLKIDNAANGQRVFEGKAQAISRSNRLQQLVPNLVDALFTDFPGNSGETLRITIKSDDKVVKRTD